MLWQAVLAGAIVTVLGLMELYLFVRQNIHDREVDWDEPEEAINELLNAGPIFMILLVVGIIILALGFLR